MRIVRGACEIALSKEDLAFAMRLWVKHVTMGSDTDFQIESVTQHPGNKYVLRMVVKPPEKVAEIKDAATAKAAVESRLAELGN